MKAVILAAGKGTRMKEITRTRPNYIFLDDGYPSRQLQKFINRLRRQAVTKDIPVAILKSSNRSQLLINGIQDFLLKENFSAEKVFSAIVNSRKIKRTQRLLFKSFIRTRNRYYSISMRSHRFVQQLVKKI